MGYLTTITIYNDGIDLLQDEKNAVEFAQKLLNIAHFNMPGGKDCNPEFFFTDKVSLGVGNFGNFCTVQKPRHSSETAVYVHSDNTVVEVNPYEEIRIFDVNKPMLTGQSDKKAELIYKKNKSYFNKILKTLITNLKGLVSFMSHEDLRDNIFEDTGILPNHRLKDKIHQELLLESFKNKGNRTLQQYVKLFN